MKDYDDKAGPKDSNLHQASGMNYRYSNTFAHVTFFGNKLEDMPIVTRVGDILRIQCVNCNEFKGQRQFSANTYNQKSKWAIYRGTNDYSDESMERRLVGTKD